LLNCRTITHLIDESQWEEQPLERKRLKLVE
jgi:hypothetical protein